VVAQVQAAVATVQQVQPILEAVEVAQPHRAIKQEVLADQE
jgi:hypothetical protein